jgi:hypothetical protein
LDGEFLRSVGGPFLGAFVRLCVTAGGTSLGPSPREALQQWLKLPVNERKGFVPVGERGAVDKEDRDGQPPPGSLALKVYYRHLARRPDGTLRIATQTDYRQYRKGWRDYLFEAQPGTIWLTEAEWKAFIPAEPREGDEIPVPGPLTERFICHYLNPVSAFGAASPWQKDAIRAGKLSLVVAGVSSDSIHLRLQGLVRMGAPFDPGLVIKDDGEAAGLGYEPRLYGWLDYDTKKGVITRFDLVALGDFYGKLHGSLADVYRPGRQPLGISFELANQAPPIDRVGIGPAVVVRDTAQLRTALSQARPGTKILLIAGVYRGEILVANLQGTRERPIVVAARDPRHKPIIRGGNEGLKIEKPAHLELRDLIIEGTAGNALSIDDGGTYDTRARDVTVRGLEIRRVGENGIKMSGVDGFRIEGVTIEDWSETGPSARYSGSCAIDLIGCHDGIIQSSTLINQDDRGSIGIQVKSGCRDIHITGSRFVHAGPRAVQIGGSTPKSHIFRPAPRGYEAKGIVVRENVFIGSEAAVTFASADEATVAFNTIFRPKGWVFRILQEGTASGFVPAAGGGVIRDNIVAFRSDEMASAVNVGRATAPETFGFSRNWWYCLDRPERSKPELPTMESEGTYGVDPRFVDPVKLDLRLAVGSPARGRGAYGSPAN